MAITALMNSATKPNAKPNHHYSLTFAFHREFIAKLVMATRGRARPTPKQRQAAHYATELFGLEYRLRCALEKALLDATLALPFKCGLDEEDIDDLRRLLDREDPTLPTTDLELIDDDLPRVQALVTLIEARHSIGAETEATLKLWKQIETAKELRRVADARKTDLVLVALEQRRDREFLSHLSRYQAYRDAIRRFFEATVKLPNHGGLPPTSIENLSLVFSGNDDRPDPIEAWWQRRNALIFILRARFEAGVRGEPEKKGTWDEWALPDKDGPTLEELMMEEAEAEGEGDAEGVLRVEDDGKVVVNETLGLKSPPNSYSSKTHPPPPPPPPFLSLLTNRRPTIPNSSSTTLSKSLHPPSKILFSLTNPSSPPSTGDRASNLALSTRSRDSGNPTSYPIPISSPSLKAGPS
ncbi:hypothetical protein G7Y79_00016g040470 [Physcia stellaris]|nr:hypothetical protein G7Y79_00016g040470 [Physcia stellaris]